MLTEIKQGDTKLPHEFENLLQEFSDVFEESSQLPPVRSCDHAINLHEGAQPINLRPYRYSPLQKTEIEKQVHELLEKGIIQKSQSPFASPILLVKKKDGAWRMCVDYRKLNDLTIKDRFPIPYIEDLLDELYGSNFFQS